MNKKIKWILFALVALLQIICLVWTRGDYRSALIEGSEYEVPANIGFHGEFYEKNYLPVHIPLNEAVWKGGNMPFPAEAIKSRKVTISPCECSIVRTGKSISISLPTGCTWHLRI